MPTKITDTNIAATGVVAGSYTSANITVNESGQIISASSGSVSPRITNIQIADSSYLAIDDTAVSTSGGYIIITGSGFTSGCQVIIGTLVATSISFINSTTIHAQVPAQSSGTYTVYLTNTDGSVAIRVNGLNYSATPSWQTTSPLTSGVINTPISLQLQATSNTSVVYQLQTGSTLPSGLTLSSSGLLTGTVTGLTTNTTYNFTVVAIDQENQDTPQAFSITIQINDPYFEYTTLLLPGNGTNGAQNNTFLDSSTNNFTITRNGNTTQGTFTPYGSNWSNNFNGSNQYLSIANNANLTVGTSFTLECWFFATAASSGWLFGKWVVGGQEYALEVTSSNGINFYFAPVSVGGTAISTANNVFALNTWNHVAVARTGGVITLYVNGVSAGTVSNSTAGTNGNTPLYVGVYGTGGPSNYFPGYISNLRINTTTAVYTAAFTPPTSPLTAVSGTQFLTCQSNRFIDNSSNAFAITVNGSPTVVAFSPFNPTASWSAAAYGGSGYFDGSDSLVISNVPAIGTQNFTVECWIYPTALGAYDGFISSAMDSTTAGISLSRDQVWIGGNTPAISYNWSSLILTGRWTHLAITRESSTVRIFVNGIVVNTQSNSTNMASTTYAIGRRYADYNGYYSTTYISDVRVINGTAVYTSNFTPPTAPVTNITNTSLLLNFTNAGIYDATGKNNLETVGNAQISTTQSKWGGSSISFDGTGDYLSAANTSRGLEMLTGDFTIECWIRFNVVGNGQIVTGLAAANTIYWQYYTSQLAFGQNNVANIAATNWSPSSGVWYHIAVTRSGSTVRQFVDGTQLGSNATSSASFPNGPIQIGDGGAGGFNGYIQDLRITKGYARYTANFTAPTAAFQTL